MGTLKSYQAKLQIAEAFAELVEEMPAEYITVNMIVEKIGKHRKTFYYHFADKSQLIVWLFRYDLACGLRAHFDEDALVYEDNDPGSLVNDFPYYARKFNDNGHIYNALFFSTFAEVLEQRREYYRVIFSYRGPGSLDYYLEQLYRKALEKDIEILAENEIKKYDLMIQNDIRESLTQENAVSFLAEFYAGAFLSRMTDRIHYSSSRRKAKTIRPYENVVHDSIQALVHREALKVVS